MHSLAMAPALSGHTVVFFLFQLSVLLTLAILFGRLAARFGLPALAGELLVGVLLGPSVLGGLPPEVMSWLWGSGNTNQSVLVEGVGQLGVLLLVGVTGAQLNLGLLRTRATAATRVSAAGLIVPLGLGVGLGFLLPALLIGEGTERTTFALYLGVAMCVSAIPVMAKILMDMRLQHTNTGQLILTAGIIDDAAGWLLLSFVSALATAGLTLSSIMLSTGSLLLFVAVAFILGRPIVRLVLGAAGRSGEPAPVLGTAVALILVAAAGAHLLKLEAVLGAFVCGVLIKASGKLPDLSITPLRTFVLAVLAPIYFAQAGLRMDLRLLADADVALAGLTVLVVAIVGKFAGAYIGARLSKLSRWEALAIGAGLNARGVIEVIIATIGVQLGVLNTASYTIVVLVALVTSLMAPPILRYAMNRVEREQPAPTPPAPGPEQEPDTTPALR
jgi:Kef-type K+ transport system membrane component KefB